MARCYSCNKDIGCFAYLKGVFKQYRRNRIGRRALTVFNCPHCGIECQETAVTALPPAFLIIGILYGFMKVIDYLNIDLEHGNIGLVLITGMFIFMLVCWVLWWKFVSKLKEPHKDFW